MISGTSRLFGVGAHKDLKVLADTVVIFPPERDPASISGPSSPRTIPSQVLEKPSSKDDQYRMLELMNGKECEVITGVTVGE